MNNVPESQIHPALTSKTSRKLKFGEYIYIGDENPERVIRQRTTGITSGKRTTFRAHPPVPNMLLSSKAWIKYEFTIDKFKQDILPIATNFETTDNTVPRNGDVILTKPFMAIANATTEAKLSINGKGISYSEPRYFQKYMGQLFCPNGDIDRYFSTCGGPYPENTGAYEETEPRIDLNNGSSGDDGFDAAADRTFQQYVNIAGVGNSALIQFYEPIYIGPFNWAYDIKERLPDKYWGKKMSNLIPYVRDIDYSITTDKLAANCFYYSYGQTTGAGFDEMELLSSTISSAEMVLQWVKPRDLEITYEKPYATLHGVGTTMIDYSTMGIPPEVKLQSWMHQHHVFNVDDGGIVVDGALSTITIPVIHMYQVPSCVLMFATVDKDSAEYRCLAATFSDNNGGNNGTNFSLSSIEPNLAFRDVTININADKETINNRYDAREMYNITLKNSKKDFPYDFAKYVGGQQRRASYPGNTCVLFSSEDLNIPMTTGRMTTDFTFSGTVRTRAETGHYIKNSFGNHRYRLHIFFLYDKYYMKINSKGDVDFRYESVY